MGEIVTLDQNGFGVGNPNLQLVRASGGFSLVLMKTQEEKKIERFFFIPL